MKTHYKKEFNKDKNRNKNENASKDYIVRNKTILLDFLLANIQGQSRNNIKNLLTRKYVLVNGSVVSQYNYELSVKDVVSICKNPSQQKAKETVRYTKKSGLDIIYEDENIIVINKPAGLLSIASDNEKVETAYRMVLDYLKANNPRNRVYVTHRIDKETSGVLMFSKNVDLRDELQDSWNDIVTKRGYYALVEGKLEKEEDTIVNYLMETSTNVMYASNDKKHGKKAVTHYKVIKSNNKYSLLDVNIDSGRKNQIRVALSNINHPIVGDDKYGNKVSAIKRLGLHAYELDIKIRGKEYKFVAKMPACFNSVFSK
jgi:RluA family pseudouridine synthase